MNRLSIILFFLFLFFSSCSNCNYVEEKGVEVVFKYATFLKCETFEDYKKIKIINPWDTTKILKSYILQNKNSLSDVNLNGEILIKTPLKNVAVFETLYCGLIDEFGEYNSISGVCDVSYINIEKIKIDCQNGKISDLGNCMKPNIEKILDLNPEAIFMSALENGSNRGQLERISIPIIECAEYMEQSPLGRAEWLKFYAMFYEKEDVADSIFNVVEKKYNELKKNISHKNKKVIYGLKNGSAWYVPCANSYVANIIKDAGGEYCFEKYKGYGSVPLSVEAVLDNAYDSDYWIFCYYQSVNKTLTKLSLENEFYSKLKSFKEKKVFACNTFYSLFYEETSFHPERFLKDIVNIIGEYNNDSLKYFTDLKDIDK